MQPSEEGLFLRKKIVHREEHQAHYHNDIQHTASQRRYPLAHFSGALLEQLAYLRLFGYLHAELALDALHCGQNLVGVLSYYSHLVDK
jgi:hypothetical protein